SDHAGGGHSACIGTFVLREERLFRDHVDGAKCFLECRNRFQISNHPYFLSIGDAAFDSASAVTQVVEAMLFPIVGNLIVSLRTAIVSNAHTLPDLNSLDGVHAHDGLSETAIQPVSQPT